MIEIKNVTKAYGKKKALDNVSFTVGDGRVCGFMGLNGAGKSTLIKIMAGLTFADSGTVLLNGRDAAVNKGDSAVPCGFMIESPGFYTELTGRQNLKALAILHGNIPNSRIDEVLKLTGMTEQANKLYRKYSLGMKQRLYFAYALMPDPQILVLDEPFNGIDPLTIQLFRNIIADFAKKGCSVLISGHVLSSLENVCDCICIIDRGKIVHTNDDVRGLALEPIFFAHVSDTGQVL